MSPLARMLSNLCFCGSCVARGKAKGLDVAHVRDTVNRAIQMEVAGEAGDLSTNMAEDAELVAFAENQVSASTELVDAVVRRLDGRARVSANVLTPYRSLFGEERDDQLLTTFIESCDQVDMHVLNPVGNRHIADLNAKLHRPRTLSALYVTIRNPTVSSAAALAEAGPDKLVKNLQVAADTGVRELSLYNYGLLPDADIRAFMEAVDQLQVPA
jgi:hypothetical protein